MNNKFTLSIVAVLGLIVGLVAGHSLWPQNIATASPQGSTFSNAKLYAIATSLYASTSPSAPIGTTTALLNTDANDRFITSVHVACEGVGTSQTAYTGGGLSALSVKVATSATATITNTAWGWANIASSTLATSTPSLLMSSSTLVTATSSYPAVWPSGSYVVFNFNATNTAACTAGVSVMGS